MALTVSMPNLDDIGDKDNIAISVRNVSKCYRVFDDQRSRLLHAVWSKHTKGTQEIWALRDINFEIKRGESVAIIGRNGGGKSTLLEIITKTLTPTTGEVRVNGRVSALLELGSGFNPEYTGRDNVILNGLLLGLSREEILGRFDEIEAFAEIGAAINRPVKTYSSGMMMRLAFAVQVLCDPDILIIDEALSVGDFFFQQKCLSFIRGLCAKGVTLLFVSHDMQTVRDLCQKGLFLEKGLVKFFGGNLMAIHYYLNLTVCQSAPSPDLIFDEKISGKNAVFDGLRLPLWKNNAPTPRSILEVGVYNVHGEAVTAVSIGETLVFKVRYYDNECEKAHVMLTLHNRNNQVVTSQGTYTHPVTRPQTMIDSIFKIQFQVICNLEAGEYSFTFALADSRRINAGTVIHETPRLGPLSLKWDYQSNIPPFLGLCGIPVSIQYEHNACESGL